MKVKKKGARVKSKVVKNIPPIKKTSKKRGVERISSGIPNFDKLVGGGFEKNSTNLLIGSSGIGKSIFGMQFLLEGIKKSEPCLYITFEEKKHAFYDNMYEFGWDLGELEKKGKFYFLEYTPEKVKTMLEEGGGIIESLVLTKKIKRIVIDSITSFALLFDKDLEKRAIVLSLFNLLKKWDCTTLLTYEGEPREKKTSESILEFESDSIIRIYFKRDKKYRKRLLEILKMRGTDHSEEIHEFDVGKKGIIIK